MVYPSQSVRLTYSPVLVDGTAFDPDTIVLSIYNGSNELVATKGKADMTKSDDDYFINYYVPVDGDSGRWIGIAICTRTSDGYTYAESEVFEVWSYLWPTIDEVRWYLAGLSDDRVKDEAIEKSIVIAVTEVDNEKSSKATLNNVTRAYLAVAGYQTYLAYATEFERTMGMVPGPILNHLELLKMNADKFIEYVRGGAAPQALIGLVALRENRIEASNTVRDELS